MSSILPVRFSSLKYMAQSPAHYACALAKPKKQTKAMLLGDALDAMFFRTKEVLVFEGASRRGKNWDTFAEQNPEAVKLLAPEQLQCDGMLQALQAHKEAMNLLAEGQCQKQIEWTMSGRPCRGTPDCFTRNQIVELKTCRTANPNYFPYDARKMAYHAQLAWYLFGLVTAGLAESKAACSIVAVESSPPYPVTIFSVSNRAFDEGTKLWRLWFERLLVCEASNVWPAYTEAVVEFDTPDTDSLTLTVEGEEMEID